VIAALIASSGLSVTLLAHADMPSTPWGAPSRAVVSRSDIFVGQPNILPSQAMPLGNGRLGAALWAAGGMTIQLNRADTLPGRLSPGQIVIPGLKNMIADKGFTARLALFDGEWHQAGAGMSARVRVDRDWDRLIIDVSGANPDLEQTVFLKLWAPRAPRVIVQQNKVMLAEHWLDTKLPGASGLPFGSLAAMRVSGRNILPLKIGSRTVALRFRPMLDGKFRLIVAAPAFDGMGDPVEIASKTLDASVDELASQRWWNDFWTKADLIVASSKDGSASYFESLRMIFLYASAAQNGGEIPGSQAGVADMFSAVKDVHFWDPAAFWAWNLRMQVAANLSAGLPELNEPFFALYRNNLDTIRRWTRAKMAGREGICIPETMRFNGVGVEFESDELRPFAIITHSCDGTWSSTSNARTLTTGAEVGLWAWETFLKTGDRAFLEKNYVLMADAARFLLAYQKPGEDGLLHTHPSNAHETQHDVIDPTTDLSAIRMLYPATIQAAHLLGRDTELAQKLTEALERTPVLPLMQTHGRPDALSPAAAQGPGEIIAPSFDFNSPARNSENIGLEPVWPYGLVNQDSALFENARRTYAYRPFRNLATWSNDPIHAARLGLAAELAQSLYALTQLYQAYPNGMADGGGGSGEFYIEQAAVVALALSEALVQDHGEVLRIAPAAPMDWTMSGTVFVRGNARVSVDVLRGVVSEFRIIGAATHAFKIISPWNDRDVVESISGAAAESVRTEKGIIDVLVEPGKSYSFRPRDRPPYSHTIEQDTLGPASKSLGRAAIGLGTPCCAAPSDYDPRTSDR
jgi:hypothetical protein